MTLNPRALATVRSPALRELRAYWDRCRAGRPMPSRADIDPLDIPRLLANLILTDVEADTGRMKVRLVGTKVVLMYGSDYTGRYLDEIDFGDRREAVLHDYGTCVLTRVPYMSEHSFWSISGAAFRIERIILPLSDNGEAVTMLLAGLDFEAVR